MGEAGNGETIEGSIWAVLGHGNFVVDGPENYPNDKANDERIDETNDASKKSHAVAGEEVRKQKQMRPHMRTTFEHEEVGDQEQSYSRQKTEDNSQQFRV